MLDDNTLESSAALEYVGASNKFLEECLGYSFDELDEANLRLEGLRSRIPVESQYAPIVLDASARVNAAHATASIEAGKRGGAIPIGRFRAAG